MSILHVFYDTHMGASHKALGEMFEAKAKRDELAKGEYVVFLNSAWTACKVLCPNNVIMYWRSATGRSLTPDTIRSLPSCVSGSRLSFAGNLEAKLIAEYEKRHKERAAKLRIA